MNKSKRIVIDPNIPDQDNYIFFDLEQDISTYEILTLKIDQNDIYQYFNADYGVLIGRVVANNNVGVPNAKVSIFIPLDSVDQYISNIVSVYPYKTPRDLNNEGKRYNLLPRVATFNQATGTYKPKQPFGSFPIKEEVVTNDNYLEVYKKYYKYTALTNDNGDYMMFGIPTGVQTVHLSVDITDIGKYSMTPVTMVVDLGYSPYLFYDNSTKIKPSTDLNILPNIETQEISVNIIPYWGDTGNFTIGITRQDFRIRAEIKASFTLFGTTTQMGEWATIGDPDLGHHDVFGNSYNDGFYRYSYDQHNNYDIRTFRPAPFTVRVFTFTPDVPVSWITGTTYVDQIDYNTQVYEVPTDTYYTYNQGGDFLLSIPCNRNKVITDDAGNETLVPDDSPYGIFKDFYGIFIFEYPQQTIVKQFSANFVNDNSPAHFGYGKFKFPQSNSLLIENPSTLHNNNLWRHENFKFEAGKFYSVAQFLTTSYIDSVSDNTYGIPNSANRLDNAFGDTGGVYFKVAGLDQVSQNTYDQENYIIAPTGNSTYFKYDFPDNAFRYDAVNEKMFGAQWLNLCVVFPQYIWAFRPSGTRNLAVADFLYGDFTHDDAMSIDMVTDNTEQIFAGITNSNGFISGFAYPTTFIDIPSSELAKLNDNTVTTYAGKTYQQTKGLNITLNNQEIGAINLDLTPYIYRPQATSPTPRAYNTTAWDVHAGEYSIAPTSAYIFKGMYENNCVKLLFDLGFL